MGYYTIYSEENKEDGMLFIMLIALDVEGGLVVFSLKTDANRVVLTGDFLNWSEKGIVMTREGDVFRAKVKVLPGIHQYKFIVDGKWIEDPSNPLKTPDGYGGFNSVFILTTDGQIITEPLIKSEDGGVKFVVYAPDARSVYLAGDFNNWDKTATPMVRKGNLWSVVISLTPGAHRYKFIIDGQWIEDRMNPAKVTDGYGGFNSVITLKHDGTIVFGEESPYPSGVPVVDKLESEGEPVYFTIVWHQHQPLYYKENGKYVVPWVRLHAIKDYYDMAEYADKYNVHFVVNLTPSLLVQIEDIMDMMNRGEPPDVYMELTMKPADKLTDEDKKFIISNFFSANWDNMIRVHKRYGELLDKRVMKPDGGIDFKATMKHFTVQDYRDLQVWFNLAWFDPEFQEGEVKLPDGGVVSVKSLVDKGENFTEEDKKILFEAQRKIINAIIPIHKKLQDEGKIEVTTTPFYHPILPLVYNTDIARVCMPGAGLPSTFSYPVDAEEHVKRAVDYYEKLFGRKPVGMWPGEGSLSEDVIPIFKKYGVEWVATDEGILQRSIGVDRLTPEKLFNPYMFNGVCIIFRLRDLSDAIGFRYQKMNGVDAANDLILRLHEYQKRLNGKGRFLITLILDGENAWEWYRHDGREFLDALYSQLERAGFVKTTTVKDYIKNTDTSYPLDKLWPGSWINSDFNIWIGEPQENTAWEYLKRVRIDFEKMKHGQIEDRVEEAYGNILAAEGSDWFWWYGNDQNSLMDDVFDRMFRAYLKNVYRAFGKKPPSFLDLPVM